MAFRCVVVRKRLTALCAILGLPLSYAVFAAQIDQQQLNSSGGGSAFNTVAWVGQTFVPTVTGALSQLDLSLFCFQCAGANPDVIVDVRTTSGGLPTATVLATTTLPGFASSSSTFYSAAFTSPAMLTAGVTYAFTLHGATARATGTYAASFSTSAAAYPNGARVGSSNAGMTWTILGSGFPATPRDLTFRTLMKLAQQIDFAPLAGHTLGEPDFVLTATATSGLPVSFSASGACSLSGTTVHIISVGACTITATQMGDDTFAAANPVTQTFAITYASTGQCLGSPGHEVLPPLAADGSSIVRHNATIPVKFRVCDANAVSIGTPGVVTSFTLLRVIEGTAATEVTIEPVSITPDTAFRWDASAQQWIFNLSTKSLAAGATYVYAIGLNDGTSIEFTFGVR
jgi:hypothetical protein